MRTENRQLYSAVLNNNCPECYSNKGVQLEFSQEFKENRWYKKYTDSITSVMNCTNCNTTIYPVSWTQDIERVYEYHQKSAGKNSTKTHWKLSTLVAILVLIALLVTATVVALTYYK